MPDFITRVELHGPNPDYEQLHREMAARHFYRTIVGNTGTFVLPTAMYFSFGDLSVFNVQKLAEDAASELKTTYSVLVVEAANWSGFLTISK